MTIIKVYKLRELDFDEYTYFIRNPIDLEDILSIFCGPDSAVSTTSIGFGHPCLIYALCVEAGVGGRGQTEE
ncbi:hypothetical protein IEQ34_003289 [Dendrobium chrysotoxum]|uniref:Uncharacterized protein n=1 Tax=Dendrobium chrysotoxum TaxID=161865 RepID=A0AAV7HGQ2_DENCH|nr:hypothetical protein IEQ34_003289 [Dendrobium chrysotoxum]